MFCEQFVPSVHIEAMAFQMLIPLRLITDPNTDYSKEQLPRPIDRTRIVSIIVTRTGMQQLQ